MSREAVDFATVLAEHFNINGTHFSVLKTIADALNQHGTNTCFMNQKTIAKKTRCSERTVQRSIRHLVDDTYVAGGVIWIERKWTKYGRVRHCISLNGWNRQPANVAGWVGAPSAQHATASGWPKPTRHPVPTQHDNGAEPARHLVRTYKEETTMETTTETTPPLSPAVVVTTIEGEGIGFEVVKAVPSAPTLPKLWMAAREAVAELIAGALANVTLAVVVPLLQRLGPPDGTTPDAYVRDLVRAVDGIPSKEWPALVDAIAAGRGRDLPPMTHARSTIEGFRNDARRRAEAQAAIARAGIAEPIGTDAVAWKAVKAEFEKLAGQNVVAAYFTDARVLGLGGGQVVKLVLPTRAHVTGLKGGHGGTLQAAFARALRRQVEVETIDAEAYVRRVAKQDRAA